MVICYLHHFTIIYLKQLSVFALIITPLVLPPYLCYLGSGLQIDLSRTCTIIILYSDLLLGKVKCNAHMHGILCRQMAFEIEL